MGGVAYHNIHMYQTASAARDLSPGVEVDCPCLPLHFVNSPLSVNVLKTSATSAGVKYVEALMAAAPVSAPAIKL